MSETPWQYHIYGVLTHQAESKILVLPVEASWSLPYVVIESDESLDELNQAIGKVLDAKVTTLRFIHVHEDEENHQGLNICEIENHSKSWEPPTGGRWIGRLALTDLILTRPEHRSIMDAYLAEVESGRIPELRPPWARRGWFDIASAWIEEQIDQLGYKRTGPIEQFWSWSISCILRGKTDAGLIYFKQAARLPLFSDEPSVTKILSEYYPERIPLALAIDRERDWLLLKDFGTPMGDNIASETQEAMFRTFARMQIDAAQHVDDLLAIGCLDRRLNKLSMHLDSLLGDTEMLSKLDETEIKKLHEFTPRLKEMCRSIVTYLVPQTLVHGDLHWGNVAYKDDNFIFFDWTDACITHPFFDMISIFGEEEAAKKQRWRDAYLDCWIDHEPMERLLKIWKIAEPLSALHQMISYQSIVNGTEQASKWELEGEFVYFTRRLLKWVNGN